MERKTRHETEIQKQLFIDIILLKCYVKVNVVLYTLCGGGDDDDDEIVIMNKTKYNLYSQSTM